MHSSRMRTAGGSSRQLIGGVCLSACCDTPGCGPGDPLGVGLETSPGVGPGDPPGCGPADAQPDPSTSLLGCGPGDLQGMLNTTPMNRMTDRHV